MKTLTLLLLLTPLPALAMSGAVAAGEDTAAAMHSIVTGHDDGDDDGD